MSVSRNYFQKFPAISYNDYVIRDISARIKLNRYLQESGVTLLPYTIKEGERADNIASFYYDDPFYAWAIYLANGIIDPYAEWPKDQQTFIEYIEKTYGSFEASLDEIVRYEVNWAEDTSLISPEKYETLPPECKKYWEAQFGYNREIISYFRREVDTILLNNRIDTVTLIASSNSVSSLDIQVGERMYQYNFADDLAVKATVAAVDSSTPANTIALLYEDDTSFAIDFESGNSTIFVKSTQNILPKSYVVGPGIPSGTYVSHIKDGTHVVLSNTPTDVPSAGDYYVYNPAAATVTLHKVDFNEVRFASDSTRGTPNSFFTYEYTDSLEGLFAGSELVTIATDTLANGQHIRVLNGSTEYVYVVNSIINSTSLTLTTPAAFTGKGIVYNLTYHDEKNYMVGRKSGANTIVLTHHRVDTETAPNSLLANSHLSNDELAYWKPVTAYDDELQKNDMRKEIFVVDANVIRQLDEALEAILKNG